VNPDGPLQLRSESLLELRKVVIVYEGTRSATRQSHDQNWQSVAAGPSPFHTPTSPPVDVPACVRVSGKKKTTNKSRICVHMGLASLCISNRTHFFNLALLRSVYGRNGHHVIRSPSSSATTNTTTTTSTFSTFSYPPSWRHASWPQRFRSSSFCAPCAPTYHARLYNARSASWATKFNRRPSPGSFNDTEIHEETAQAAVLEAIKGRQQTDLMLRCESPVQHHHPSHYRFANSLTNLITT
jgi:hypothetical protein